MAANRAKCEANLMRILCKLNAMDHLTGQEYNVISKGYSLFLMYEVLPELGACRSILCTNLLVNFSSY